MPAKHTPGPWTLEAGRSFVTSDGTFYLTYGRDKHGNPRFRDFCALDANARLIAAAPDLLAVARGALGYLQSLPDQWRPDDAWLAPLRSAIAAAEGDSPAGG